MPSCVFSETFDNIKVGRIQGQEYEVDSKVGGLVSYSLAVLITGIFKDDGNGEVSALSSHLFKKVYDLFRIHIYHRVGVNKIQRKRVDVPKQIELVSTGANR